VGNGAGIQPDPAGMTSSVRRSNGGVGGEDGRGTTVVYAVTVATSAIVLLRGQLAALRARGMEVVLACSPDDRLAQFAAEQGVRLFPVPMSRGLLSVADARAVVSAVRILRTVRPSILNISTPKAALVFGIAGALTRVPIRIYSLWGLRLEGERAGSLRFRVLWLAERVTAAGATVVLCASASLRDRAIALSITSAARSRVLGHGSTNGVDLTRFRRADPDEARAARRRLGFESDELVLGFVGRLVADKGVVALLDAYEKLAAERPTRLLLVGDVDDADPLPEETIARIRHDDRIVLTGVTDPAPYYAAMDVFVLPSRREGLPNVVLEASAAALPVVTTRATGCPDAVVEGTTGLLVEPDDADGLVAALRALGDADLRARMGVAGRRFVEGHFDEAVVWDRITQFYDELLEAERVRTPAIPW
jgi:glycosyltransferase involved in cell wall biosynthesis